jgi:hypothetical protein
MLTAASFKPAANAHSAAALARAVEALSPRLNGQLAASLAAHHLPVVPHVKGTNVLAAHVRALCALAGKADEEMKGKLPDGVAGRLVDALAQTTDPYLLADLGRAVTALSSGRLAAKPAEQMFAKVSDKLLDGMKQTNDARALAECGRALAVALELTPPSRRATILAAASQRLQDALATATESNDPTPLVQALETLTSGLPEKERRPIAVAIVGRLLESSARYSQVGPGGGPSQVMRSLGPLTQQLTMADIVTLLRHPCCVGEGRRLLLGALGRHLGLAPSPPMASALALATLQPCPLTSAAAAVYAESLYPRGRAPFADLWEAVDFLQGGHADLLASGR